MDKPFYIFVDVDETFVRNYSTKRIPMPKVLEHIRKLKEQGAILYCWSSGGTEYAKKIAMEFGVEDCFVDYLPKPHVVVDDQAMSSWRNIFHVHPNECPQFDVEFYRKAMINDQNKT